MAVQSVKATVNDQEIILTYNDGTQAWEATTSAPSKSSYNQTGHYYGVTIVAEDDSGNKTTVSDKLGDFMSDLQLVEKSSGQSRMTILVLMKEQLKSQSMELRTRTELQKLRQVLGIHASLRRRKQFRMANVRFYLTQATTMEMLRFRNPFSLRLIPLRRL